MDRYLKVIEKGILRIDNAPSMPRGKVQGYTNFQISSDMFATFLREIKQINSSMPIICTIYDEGVVENDNEFWLRYNFIKQIKSMNFLQVEFKLSDSTFPAYNAIMDKLNWQHDEKTFLYMTVDRHPTKIKDLRLLQARGKILLPEEKLLWESDYVLSSLNGKIKPEVLEDTDKLKYVVRHYVDGIERHYDASKLTSFDKVYLAYHHIKDQDKLNIQFAHEQTQRDIDGVQRLKRSATGWESKPYGTYIKRRGVCEGQARLMRVLLNNWDMQMDAVTIDGKTKKQESHTWVGINIHNKLYYCCLTRGGLLQPMPYIPDSSEYYPKIYPSSSLSREQIADVERHVKSLKKYR